MITGDNMYTAARVGQSQNFGPSSYLFLKEVENNSVKELRWVDYDEKSIADLSVDTISNLKKKHTLCIEGQDLKFASEKYEKNKFNDIVKNITIFARVNYTI